jgi:RNA polymerase sigma factor (sigma-70 family)
MDTDQAADVFQDVCLALHRGLPRLKSTRALTTWILKATQRITRDHRVKASRTTSLDAAREAGGIAEQADGAPLPSDAMEELELQHELRAHLARMDERCRRLLLLLFYTDPQPSYSEIGRELKIPGGSIGPTRARCFERLRKNLGKAGA